MTISLNSSATELLEMCSELGDQPAVAPEPQGDCRRRCDDERQAPLEGAQQAEAGCGQRQMEGGKAERPGDPLLLRLQRVNGRSGCWGAATRRRWGEKG